MCYPHESREPVRVHSNRCYEVEPEKSQIRQIFDTEIFIFEVGVDEPEPP
jgi:hypothetical protein